MTIDRMPKFDEMMLPTLDALKALGGSGSNDELFDRVVADLGIPDAIRDQPHGDGSVGELAYRLAWTRTYLHQVGAIARSQRGVWSITDKGEAVTAADIDGIKRTVTRMGRTRRNAYNAHRVPKRMKLNPVRSSTKVAKTAPSFSKASSERSRLRRRSRSHGANACSRPSAP